MRDSEILKLKTELAKKESEILFLKGELKKNEGRESEVEDERRAIIYMLEDINESTSRIELARKEWEATFDAIAAPILLHDEKMRIIRVNSAYQKYAGIPFAEIIGKPYYTVFPKLDRPFDICLNPDLDEGEEDIAIPSMGKTFKIKLYRIKAGDREKSYSIHIMEDITEAKRNVEIIKEEMEVTAHLLMIAEATTHTTDIDRLVEDVIHCNCKIMRSDVCLSYLWDETAGMFRPAHECGMGKSLIPFFRTETIGKDAVVIRQVLEANEPRVFHAPFPEAEFKAEYGLPPEWFGEVKAITITPLASMGQKLGLIICMFRNLREITDRDKRVMKGVAHQFSTALGQAKLYRYSVDKAMELSHKIETIQVMHEIDRSILSTLEPQEILENSVMMITRLITADRVTVALVDEEKQGFIFSSGFGVTSIPKGSFIPFSETSGTEVIYSGRPQYISDMGEMKSPFPLERKFLKEGFLSHIRVPLVVKGEVIGVLTVGSKRKSAYTPEDLQTLEKIASQISVALENSRLVADLQELFLGTVKSLSSAIDTKSPWTAGHSERVTRYAISIGKELGFSEKELKELELAGLLHDIGKIGTYEAILDKPGKLTDDETKIMREHPAKGAEILAPIKLLKNIRPAIKYHHEFYNGGGYPEGLKGEGIPLFARVLTVADTVDAMAADRPYRKGLAMTEIIAELQRCSGTQFDPKIVKAFLLVLNGPQVPAKV
ncbi:MAG: GAF domain-containing protein [Deltaproteobacteria bacterium]|nr:GAF domain-containing protein [Deltaproteobacteria bacterium]